MYLDMSRRKFLGLASGVAVVVALAPVLGCSANSNDGDGRAAQPTNGAGDFSVPDAFGDAYKVAYDEVCKSIPDAVLTAVRVSCAVAPFNEIHWDYLFASESEHVYYIVFTGDSVVAAKLGDCTILGTDWKNIPSVAEVRVDASEAYKKVCEACPSDVETRDLYAYLILFSESDDEDSYVYEDASLTWFFEFNSEPASDGEGKDAASGENAVPDDMMVFSVNASSGKANRVYG